MYPQGQKPNVMGLAEISYLHLRKSVSLSDYFQGCPVQYFYIWLAIVFIWKFESL